METPSYISSSHFSVSRTTWVFWGALLSFGCSPQVAQTPAVSPSRIVFRTAQSVLSIPNGLAARGSLAKVNGIVTFTNRTGLVVQDSTGGIWLANRRAADFYAPGDEITAVGTVEPGRYSPQIETSEIKLIGHGPLPIPKAVSLRQLNSGQEDAQYVSIGGTVRAVSLLNNVSQIGDVRLTIATPEGRVDAILPSQYGKAARDLIDAKIRIAATVLCLNNDNKQATGVVLGLSGLSEIKVLQPGPRDLFSVPIVPIGSLMRYRSNTDYFHRIRLRGVLTYYGPGRKLVLQDGIQAIKVNSTDSAPLQLGDHIEAAGFPAPDLSGPVLQDAVIKSLSHGTPLAPVPIDSRDVWSSIYRFSLISIDMRFLRIIDEPSQTLFLFERGNQITTAEMESRLTAPPKFLVPGSIIRVSGIDLIAGTGEGLAFDGSAANSKLLVRSLSDLSLITPAPWGSQTHLFYLAMVLGILTLAFIILLTYVQLKRWKIETVLQERERLAHDIHDTLAQSFAGIGFQLQVIRKAIANGDPNLRKHVDIAANLVRFSHREARKSLVPASVDDSQHADLEPSLKACAQAMVESGLIDIEAYSSGTVRPLPGPLNAQLFRIGQEAISNAIRHAEPTRLVITIDYRDDSVCLKVVDNGCGFTMRGDLLGFGIRGMRKRASEIAGDLEITTSPGAGTCVSVTVQLPQQKIFFSPFITLWNFGRTILEGKAYAASRR